MLSVMYNHSDWTPISCDLALEVASRRVSKQHLSFPVTAEGSDLTFSLHDLSIVTTLHLVTKQLNHRFAISSAGSDMESGIEIGTVAWSFLEQSTFLEADLFGSCNLCLRVHHLGWND